MGIGRLRNSVLETSHFHLGCLREGGSGWKSKKKRKFEDQELGRVRSGRGRDRRKMLRLQVFLQGVIRLNRRMGTHRASGTEKLRRCIR